MRIVAFTSDLMDRSRLTAAGELVGVGTAPELVEQIAEGGVDVVVIDLSRPGAFEAIDVAVAAGARTVAYGPHVDDDALTAARAAGAEALPRSRFFRSVAEVLSEAPPPSP